MNNNRLKRLRIQLKRMRDLTDSILTELHEATDDNDLDLIIDLKAELAKLEQEEASLEIQIQTETDIEQTKGE